MRAHPAPWRAGSLPPLTGRTHEVQARAHAGPRSRLVSRTDSQRGWGRRRGSPTGYTRNPASQLHCPPPRWPTVDTFVCLLIEKQGGGRTTKGSRTQAGPAVLFQALTPAEGTQQRGAARPQLTRVGIPVARGRSAPSGPRPRRCPADSGLPHCGEARRASAGALAGTGQRRGGDSGTSAGRRGAHTQAGRPWVARVRPLPGAAR